MEPQADGRSSDKADPLAFDGPAQCALVSERPKRADPCGRCVRRLVSAGNCHAGAGLSWRAVLAGLMLGVYESVRVVAAVMPIDPVTVTGRLASRPPRIGPGLDPS